MLLGEKLKMLLDKKGISVEFLAGEIGITVSTVYYMFKQDNVNSKYLKGISEVLEIPVDDILNEDLESLSEKMPSKSPSSKYTGDFSALLKSKDEIIQEKERMIQEKERFINIQKDMIELLKNQNGK